MHVWWCGCMHVFCPPVSCFLKDLRPGCGVCMHLNSITLLEPFLINICSSFLMPLHDSVCQSERLCFICDTLQRILCPDIARVLHHCGTSMNLQANTPSASKSLWSTNHLQLNLVYLTNTRRLQINPLECSTCLSCVLLL